MGVLDKFLDAIKVNDDEELLDDDLMDEDDDFLDDDMEEKPKKKFFERFAKKQSDDEEGGLDDFSFNEEDDIDEEPVKAKPAFRSAPKFESKVAQKPAKAEKPARQSAKITPMRSSRRNSSSASVEVCVIRPTSMEDTREIADTLIDNSTVILNLEGIDVELAQRIIDFTLGACYSLNGTLQKVSSYIFVLGPSNVDITGDLQNMIGNSAPSVRAGY
ncbi:MAG: cell division protein SepF [Eubacteriales bacterium]|nr:cell division protein SepF [Eubacteriales bacterium]